MRNTWILAVLLLPALLLGGCGAAKDAWEETVDDIKDINAVEGALIGILMRDDPTEEYDSIFVTVYSVSLLSDESEPVVLYESLLGEEMDLLDLQDEGFLLAMKPAVPAGLYNKIRLEVGNVHSEGGPCDDLEIKLESNKIDLAPEEPIEVIPGGALLIELDMDANKSMKLDVAGKSGKCTFRPVVFVEVTTKDAPDRCPRSVFGTIVKFLANDDDVIVGFILDLGEGRGKVEVALDKGTSIFDEAGLPGSLDDLDLKDEVTIKGKLNKKGVLRALAIVVGEAMEVDGTAGSAVEDGLFSFTPDSGEALVGETSVSVEEETLVLLGCDLSSAKIIDEGARVTITGKYSASDKVLRACAIVVQPDRIEGDLLAFDDVLGGLQISVRPDGEEDPVKIFVPKGVKIQLKGAGPVPLDLLADLLDCDPRPVTVLLSGDEPGTATAVLLESADLDGTIDEEPDLIDRLLTVDESVVAVMDWATVLDLRDGQSLITFADLMEGDNLRVFGLEACEQDDVDFYAFVVLVLEDEDS
jgi:hypothetical protein